MARNSDKSGAGVENDPLDTPFMRQFLDLKRQVPDAILFFRMGDFYELFLEDAEEAAPLMDVALTKRQSSVPMCGVPYHSAEIYIARLIGAGKRVAIAEQENDPANPKLMRRRLRRIITPGTVLEESLLDGAGHSYLMALAPGSRTLGLALADVSTGDFFSLDLPAAAAPVASGAASVEETSLESRFGASLRDAFYKYAPREILAPSDYARDLAALLPEARLLIAPCEPWKASPTEGARQIAARFGQNLKGLGYPSEKTPALGAAGLVLHYLAKNFPDQIVAIGAPAYREGVGARMLLDEQTIRNLDLIQNQNEGGSARSLYGCLDRCKTAAGKRFLKDALLAPLLDRAEILRRQERVATLVNRSAIRARVADALGGVFDLERALARMSAGRGAPRDFAHVAATVEAADELAAAGRELTSEQAAFVDWIQCAPELRSLAERITRTVAEEPPAVLGGGPFLRPGLDAELDRAREAQERGSKWIADFERAERERTGISTLRVKYNKVFGYFIEISKGQADNAPADYERKQTLVGYERFTSDKLAHLETELLAADETVARVEERWFRELEAAVLQTGPAIKQLMTAIGEADFLQSLAEIAARRGWTRPEIAPEGSPAGFDLDEGRHPVVEEFLPTGQAFIPNNLRLHRDERSFAVITGPNMAGKSTYIRQIGLIQILAQIGSFAPAQRCALTLADRVFTRIGAGDNLTRGESTFFVEMLETARILNQCSAKSLVIMDEVGRGTSTYDGISLAWSIVEHLSEPEGARPLTLFATHYHELTALAERDYVFNLTMDVEEVGGRVVFLHRVREGAADRSYGIHVARLAGLPETVLARAEEKLAELEKRHSESRVEESTKRKTPRRSVREPLTDQTLLF